MILGCVYYKHNLKSNKYKMKLRSYEVFILSER
jgi:hypothetical protein